MSYCEQYARQTLDGLKKILCPEGGEWLTLSDKEPLQDEYWEESAARFREALEVLEGEDAAKLTFALCVTLCLYPDTMDYLRRYAHLEVITLENLAQFLYKRDYNFDPPALERASYKLRLLLPDGGEPYYRAPLAADSRLMDWLGGMDRLPDALAGIVRLFPSGAEPQNPMFARTELPQRLQKLLEWLSDAGECGQPLSNAYVQISGKAGSGKKFLVETLASEVGFGVLFVDAARLMEQDDEHMGELLRLIRREVVLGGDMLCFYKLVSNEDERQAEIFLRRVLEPLTAEFVTPVILCTDPEYAIVPYTDVFVAKLELPDCTCADRIDLWQGFWCYYGLHAQGDFVRYATTYKTSPRDIGKAVRRLAQMEQEGELVDDATVARANYTSLPRAVSGTIVRPPRGWTLDDLKLPEVQKQTLRHVCAQVLRRHQVYDEWGMEGKFPYGKAVAALFVGPSGTGKTMAANILASTLGLSLYRVDLSRVVDKYIGETEKRLEQIFTAAEKSNSILFFDEADSIFGKRSQVKEANDRFANIQVSYILQRLEDYDGVVILASNLRSNIDEAFMRRMRYVVEFQIPGEELRRELWQSGFAPQVPQENIDYSYLARQFELAGGAIKNIALNATFLAADEERAVTMKDILDSVRGENLKIGKAMLAQDFAEYSALQR